MPRKKTAETAGAATPPTGERRMIPLDLIDPNPWNGHRMADDDLVASVIEHGILQNLVVRPVGEAGEDRFQIVSGTRRAWAAKLAELKEVPCLVCELTDREAREITIIENLQREDLHPVDEAKAIAALLEDGHTKEEVAARLGKTPAFVTRRVKLANLSERVIEEAGDDLRRMSIRALELLATLPEAKQCDLFDGWGGVTLEAKQVAYQIRHESNAIAGAIFDCADETLVPEAGACANCPKRTGFEPLLFDDLGDDVTQEDHCLDRVCYQLKLDAQLARSEAKAREKHGEALILITPGMPYGSEAAELKKRGVQALAPNWHETGLKRCKKSEKGATPAFIVHGKGQGTTAWVRDVKAAAAAEGDSSGAGEPETPADPMERKREKLDQRRYAWIATKLTGMVGGEDDEGNRRLPAEKYCSDAAMVRIAAAFGGSSCMDLHPDDEDSYNGDEFAFWAQSAGVPVKKLYYHVWDAAASALRKAMQVFKVSDIDHDFVDGLKIVADLVGVSWHGLWNEACEAIPEPKSWSRA